MKTPITPFVVQRAASGFTLIELMIAVAILAILLGIAAPNFREAVLNARMSAQANDLLGDLNLARAEAVRRDRRVYLCTSNNGTACTASPWNSGWIVFVDLDNDATPTQDLPGEAALKTRPALNTGNSMTVTGDLPGGNGAARYVLYRPSGTSNVGGLNVVFVMCDIRNTAAVGAQRAQDRGRTITINATGRAVIQRRTCADATS